MNSIPPSTQFNAAAVLEVITDGFYVVDREWRFVYINAQAERMLARTREELLGCRVWAEFPELLGTVTEREYLRSIREKTPLSFEQFFPSVGRWFEARVTPSSEGMSVFFQEITQRVEQRQRDQFLADFKERLRRMTDPDAVIDDAVRSIGEFLGVSRCVFADIDLEADTCTIPLDYRADDSVSSMAGVFPISLFGPFLVGEYGAGRTVAIDDVRTEPIRVPQGFLASYEAVTCRAFVAAPVLQSDRLVSVIAIHSTTPRHWKPEEVSLLKAVVERTWLTVEVTRQNRALKREAEERREIHERTARTLESITDAFYSLDTEWRFTYLNAQAERLLFRTREELLGQNIWEAFPEAVEGPFYHLYRRAMSEGIASTIEDYYAPLDSWLNVRVYPSPEGLSMFFQNVNERKRNEEALRESEERLRLATEGAGVGIWKLIPETNELTWTKRCCEIFGLPTDGTIDVTGEIAWAMVHPEDVIGMKAAMKRTARANKPFSYEYRVVTPEGHIRWVQADGKAHYDEKGKVVCVEGVMIDSTPQRESIERMAAAYQKERHIAEELQVALTPAIPNHVPGLALAKYYEAALEEAGVGGDFYDVFVIDKGCTALVVGDVSGKGLAAASQVATVRNMLRYAIYRAATLVEGLMSLNLLLAEQNLLTGFATLFIGAYDPLARTLSYVNAGQEPALLRRAEGGIELLAPTGPILGSFKSAVFEEMTVRMNSGDAVAIFTDGLTEVGRSRQAMLGVEGIAELLSRAMLGKDPGSASALAEQLALSLIAGVDAAAQGGMVRDDVCLLIAAAE